MKVKELIEALKLLKPECEIRIASDEELNCIFSKFEIGLVDDKQKEVIIYPLSGTEMDEYD